MQIVAIDHRSNPRFQTIDIHGKRLNALFAPDAYDLIDERLLFFRCAFDAQLRFDLVDRLIAK